MTRHPRRTLAASFVALVLLAACVLLVTSCVQVLLGQDPLVPFTTLARTGTRLTGESTPVLVAAALVALIGLVLLIVAVRPGNPTVIPLDDAGSGVDTGLARRGLDRALVDAATTVDGIVRAKVRTRRRRSTVTAHAAFGARADQRNAVRDAVASRLAAIGPAHPQRLRVRITSDKEV